MSVLRVNEITNLNDNGAVEFSKGVVLPSLTGDVTVSGVCTATSYVGSGIGITVPGGATNSKIFGITFIT